MSTQAVDPQIEIVAIRFALGIDSARTGAIPVYRPMSPEFPVKARGIIAYAISTIVVKKHLFCCFKVDEDFHKSVTIRARLKDADGLAPVAIGSLSFGDKNFSSGPSSDNPYPKGGFVAFEVDPDVLFGTKKQVGAYSSTWLWEWDVQNASQENWRSICSTDFEFFLTLDMPSYPWAWKDDFFAAPELGIAPWVGILKHACRWAANATNPADAGKQIIEAIWASSSFQYDTSPNYSKYETDNDGLPKSPDGGSEIEFGCTPFMEHLLGMSGNGRSVNCVDLSLFFLVLANSIGGNFKLGRLANTKPKIGFALNSGIYPLRGSLNQETEFMFHQIAYSGTSFDDQNALVYDACICFQAEDGTKTMVAGMPLGEYRKRLAKNEEDCKPKHFVNQPKIHIV